MSATDTFDAPAAHDVHRVAATIADPEVLARLSTSVEPSIVCLVATNPATPAHVVDRLSRHDSASVRRAVACRRGLPGPLVERLLDDPARPVRRAVWRHQDVDLETVLAQLRRGRAGGALERRRRDLVQDPAITRRLLGDPTTVWWAACGVVDRSTLRSVVADLPEWHRAHVARSCSLSDRDLVRLARDPSRQVQEAVAERSDLSDRQAARIVRRGRVWSAAAVLRRTPDVRRPLRRRLVPHRVVRRVVAERVTSRLLMCAWSLDPAWDVGCALARNPRLGRRTARLLARRAPWSVSAELARRDDVASMLPHLQLAPPVQLVLASNPATPEWAIRWLLGSTDVFIRGQAIGHPAAPLEEVRRIVAEPSTPAWNVRSASLHPGLDAEERDASLAWLALGGGVGDPDFDPVTCTGNPDTRLTPTAAYSAEARREGQMSVLWRAREQWLADHHRVGFEMLSAVASDPQWSVRRRAAGFDWLWLLDELRWDEHPMVAATASRTRGDSSTKDRAERRRLVVGAAKAFAGIAAVAAVGLIGQLTSETGRDGSPPLDVDAVEFLPDAMPRTDLLTYDDRCMVMRNMVTIGRDERGRLGMAFVAGPEAERWITFAANPTAPPLTAAHAAAGETVTVVLPLDRLVLTVVERNAIGALAAESALVDLARPAIITEDCR